MPIRLRVVIILPQLAAYHGAKQPAFAAVCICTARMEPAAKCAEIGTYKSHG
jgi:hypothetical protein